MADFTVQQGSTTPPLIVDLTYSDGSVLDLTGYTVTVSITLIGAGTPIVSNGACSIVSAAAGRARYDWLGGDTGMAGTYLAVFTAFNGVTTHVFPASGGLTVQVVPVTTAYPTVADIVRDASMVLGDLHEGTLTAAASQTSITDSTLREPAGHFTGGSISLVNTFNYLNRGVTRRITNHAANGVLTTDSFPEVPHDGDTYEIRDIPGHDRDAMKRFVAAAVRDLRSATWVEVDTFSAPLEYSYQVREYPVDPEFEYLTKVYYQDIVDAEEPWYEVPRSLWHTHRPGYIAISKYADINRCTLSIPNESPLAFRGVRRPAQVSADSDMVEVDQNYAIHYVAARMALALMKGDDANEMKDKYLVSLQESERIRKLTRERLPNGARRV